MNWLKTLVDPLELAGGGLMRKPIKKATGLTDAQMLGIGALAVAAPYALPAMGASAGAGAVGTAAAPTAGAGAAQGGLLSTIGQYAGPASQVMNIAGQAQAMGRGQPMQAPPAQFQPSQGFAGLLSPTNQVDPEKRRQAQQMAVQGLLGGAGGMGGYGGYRG